MRRSGRSEHPGQLHLEWTRPESQATAKVQVPQSPPAPPKAATPGVDRRLRRGRVVARLPVPKPLPASIAAGHFGQDDEGKPVRPGAEEVRAITERHAEKLIELLDTLAHAQTADQDRLRADFRAGITAYSEDFGQHAADQLEAYVRRQASLDAADRADKGRHR